MRAASGSGYHGRWEKGALRGECVSLVGHEGRVAEVTLKIDMARPVALDVPDDALAAQVQRR